MECINWWEDAKKLNIQTGPEIVGGFNVGFDDAIPEETRDELMKFVYWVEDNYPVPVTLWVDFKYNHYLITRDKRRVGYRFYWADFENYPVLEKEEDIPVIELPVRTENWTMKEILGSFIEGITEYYIWLANAQGTGVDPEDALVEEILRNYLDEGE